MILKWKNEIERKLMDVDLTDGKRQEIKNILLERPLRATFCPINIARVLFGENYLASHMIGPKLCSGRDGNRKEYLSETDELKFRNVLQVISKSNLNLSEWRVLVRDPVNQASRCWLVKGNQQVYGNSCSTEGMNLKNTLESPCSSPLTTLIDHLNDSHEHAER